MFYSSFLFFQQLLCLGERDRFWLENSIKRVLGQGIDINAAELKNTGIASNCLTMAHKQNWAVLTQLDTTVIDSRRDNVKLVTEKFFTLKPESHKV